MAAVRRQRAVAQFSQAAVGGSAGGAGQNLSDSDGIAVSVDHGTAGQDVQRHGAGNAGGGEEGGLPAELVARNVPPLKFTTPWAKPPVPALGLESVENEGALNVPPSRFRVP